MLGHFFSQKKTGYFYKLQNFSPSPHLSLSHENMAVLMSGSSPQAFHRQRGYFYAREATGHVMLVHYFMSRTTEDVQLSDYFSFLFFFNFLLFSIPPYLSSLLPSPLHLRCSLSFDPFSPPFFESQVQ